MEKETTFNSTKDCVDCGSEELATFKLSKFPGHTFYRNRCKPCRSNHISRKRLEEDQEKYPWKYLDCDECDHIQLLTKKKPVICRKCSTILKEK